MDWIIANLVGLALGFGGGLVVGWNVLPQPRWVRDLFVRATD